MGADWVGSTGARQFTVSDSPPGVAAFGQHDGPVVSLTELGLHQHWTHRASDLGRVSRCFARGRTGEPKGPDFRAGRGGQAAFQNPEGPKSVGLLHRRPPVRATGGEGKAGSATGHRHRSGPGRKEGPARGRGRDELLSGFGTGDRGGYVAPLLLTWTNYLTGGAGSRRGSCRNPGADVPFRSPQAHHDGPRRRLDVPEEKKKGRWYPWHGNVPRKALPAGGRSSAAVTRGCRFCQAANPGFHHAPRAVSGRSPRVGGRQMVPPTGGWSLRLPDCEGCSSLSKRDTIGDPGATSARGLAQAVRGNEKSLPSRLRRRPGVGAFNRGSWPRSVRPTARRHRADLRPEGGVRADPARVIKQWMDPEGGTLIRAPTVRGYGRTNQNGWLQGKL